MSANQLSITNFINVSVSQASPGLNAYNTSNLGLFTDEAPNLGTFGNLGYAIYNSPTQVGIDFGTGSRTSQMANAVFSQTPNILNGDGELIVILLTNVNNTLTLSGVPASGTFEVTYNTNSSVAINWNDTATQIQAKVRAVAGLSQVLVSGSLASESLVLQMAGIYNPSAITISANSLVTSGSASITITPSATSYESIGAAITRASTLVQFFGVMVDQTLAVIGQSDLLSAAAILLPLNKIGFFVSHTAADIAPGGMLDLLRSGSFYNTRGLYYGDSVLQNDLNMMAAYAGLALSVNFGGSNTTITMNLKTLNGINPDPTITQTQLAEAIVAGADTYASYQGVSAVFSSGANQFYDAVYNQEWLEGALLVAAFNYLQQAGTKVPQTESGMDGFKGALRSVLNQAITNQYLAPGTWNSPNTFGNQVLFYQNISQQGFYIYSLPVSQQLAADRSARKAPLVQIAGKAAGAIQSANIIVTINS